MESGLNNPKEITTANGWVDAKIAKALEDLQHPPLETDSNGKKIPKDKHDAELAAVKTNVFYDRVQELYNYYIKTDNDKNPNSDAMKLLRQDLSALSVKSKKTIKVGNPLPGFMDVISDAFSVVTNAVSSFNPGEIIASIPLFITKVIKGVAMLFGGDAIAPFLKSVKNGTSTEVARTALHFENGLEALAGFLGGDTKKIVAAASAELISAYSKPTPVSASTSTNTNHDTTQHGSDGHSQLATDFAKAIKNNGTKATDLRNLNNPGDMREPARIILAADKDHLFPKLKPDTKLLMLSDGDKKAAIYLGEEKDGKLTITGKLEINDKGVLVPTSSTSLVMNNTFTLVDGNLKPEDMAKVKFDVFVPRDSSGKPENLLPLESIKALNGIIAVGSSFSGGMQMASGGNPIGALAGWAMAAAASVQQATHGTKTPPPVPGSGPKPEGKSPE